MAAGQPLVDSWMQHPNERFLSLPLFGSPRRWSRRGLGSGSPLLEATLPAMDAAGAAPAPAS